MFTAQLLVSLSHTYTVYILDIICHYKTVEHVAGLFCFSALDRCIETFSLSVFRLLKLAIGKYGVELNTVIYGSENKLQFQPCKKHFFLHPFF